MAFGAWLLLLLTVGWWARHRGRSTVRWVALAGWCALPFYNAWVLSTCPGDCGIRFDLVLMIPVLLIVSAVALWSLAAQWFRAQAKRR